MSPGTRGNRVSSMRTPTEYRGSRCSPRSGTTEPTFGADTLVELGELLAHPPELRLHLLVIGSVGKVGEVALPVRQRSSKLTHARPGNAAIAPLPAGVGRQHEEAVDHRHDLRPGLLPPVDALQVGEHTRQELTLGHGYELFARELDR